MSVLPPLFQFCENFFTKFLFNFSVAKGWDLIGNDDLVYRPVDFYVELFDYIYKLVVSIN